MIKIKRNQNREIEVTHDCEHLLNASSALASAFNYAIDSFSFLVDTTTKEFSGLEMSEMVDEYSTHPKSKIASKLFKALGSGTPGIVAYLGDSVEFIGKCFAGKKFDSRRISEILKPGDVLTHEEFMQRYNFA